MRLDELNIINVENVEKYANEFLPKIEYEPAKKWFQQSVRKLLINDEKYNSRVAQVSPNAPDWMKKRYEENVPLYRFNPSGDLTNKLNHIIDWVNSVYQVSQEKVEPNAPKAAARQQLVVYATKILNSINAIDLKTLLSPKSEGAKHHVDDWFETLNKFVKVTGDKDQEMTTEDMQHIIDYDNGAWVELKSDKSLGIEGKLMGHCVGGYGRQVGSGKTRIFSLRDNDGQPHVTIEVTDGQIVQIKGKSNKTPVPKYVQYVKDFLNKMKFPPRTHVWYHGSQNSDINDVGLRYNAENQTYGTLKEIAKLDYTTPAGYEILTVPGEVQREHPIYYIWKNDTLLGTISHNYGKNIDISLNGAGRYEVTADQRKVYAEAVDFVNSAFTDFALENADRKGFYRVSAEDPKYYDIKNIPVAQTFASGEEVKKTYDTGIEYIICSPTNDVETGLPKILLTVNDNDIEVKTANINKPQFEKELAEFLNKIDFKRKSRYPSGVGDNPDILNLNIVYDDGQYKTFTEAAKPVKDWGTAKVYEIKDKSLYRVYENDQSMPIAEWELTRGNLRKIKISSDAFRKYTKQFADFLNETYVTGCGSYGDDKYIKNEMKDWGIKIRGGKWSTGKVTSTETGYTIEKVSAKQGNIVNPAGKRLGELKFESANTVETVKYDSTDRETKIDILNFLADYCAANPKLSFGNGSLGSDAQKVGFMIDNYKVIRIKDKYPTEEVLSVDDMTWKKKVMVTSDDDPNAGYKFGLYNGQNKLVLKLMKSIKNPKEVTEIKLFNINYDRNNEDYEYRQNNKPTLKYDEANIAPYVNALSELFKRDGLTANGVYLSKAGLELKNGALKVIDDNPKVRGFINGEIAYEDGTTWKRDRYDKDDWILTMMLDEDETTILKCKASDEGVTNIDIRVKVAIKKPSMYRAYLNDLLDIIEEMNAE